MKIRLNRIALLGAAFLATGCADALNCLISGDNVEGRINYSASVAPQAGKTLIIQYSTDSGFGSISGTASRTNDQGVLSMPYSLCVSEGTSYYIRAFQDSDSDGSYTAGEGSGRRDGTDSGNTAPTAVLVPSSASSDNPNEQTEIDLSLDTTGGL